MGVRLIKAYVSQEKEDVIAQRDKALDERDNARIWVKSLQRERNEALDKLKVADENADWAHDHLQLEQEHLLHCQEWLKTARSERDSATALIKEILLFTEDSGEVVNGFRVVDVINKMKAFITSLNGKP